MTRSRTTLQFFVPALVALLSWGALSFGAVYPWGYVPLLVACTELGLYGLLRWQAFSGVPGVLVASLGVLLPDESPTIVRRVPYCDV